MRALIRAYYTVALLGIASAPQEVQSQGGGGSIGCNILRDRIASSAGTARQQALLQFRRLCPQQAVPRDEADASRGNAEERRPTVGTSPRRIARPAQPQSVRPRRTRRPRPRYFPPSPPEQPTNDYAYQPPPPSPPQPRTLVSAVANAPAGQTITLSNGPHYTNGPLVIRRSIRLRGIPSANGELPIIEGSIIVEGGVVELDNVSVRGVERGSVLTVRSGVVRVLHSSVGSYRGYDTEVSNRVEYAALSVQGGNVTVSNSGIGPGISQAMAITAGTLVVRGSRIENRRGLALAALGGWIDVQSSVITGLDGFATDGRPRVSLLYNQFTVTSASGRALELRGTPIGSILENRMPNAIGQRWLCYVPSAQQVTIRGNVQSDGSSLPLIASSTSC